MPGLQVHNALRRFLNRNPLYSARGMGQHREAADVHNRTGHPRRHAYYEVAPCNERLPTLPLCHKARCLFL
ncbi:hypothetical protein D3C75_426560 [compost metagenome]